MDCPSCKEPMIVLELDKIEIDYSDSCGGIWLDAGELELLLEDSEEKDVLLESFEIRTSAKEKSRRCPICRKKMHKVAVKAAGDILIDSCRKGHGYWFDKGELEMIIKACSEERHSEVLTLLKDMFGGGR